ncbi:hypothetical protein MesoLjLc_29630 [Mesorhizobium sp. L-8-10]|uniref:hypothetical protein n=1 Tax=unclassified Mesorhizobium TaxID=325217 RepID=UPI0019374F8A|nr:MULTISPECIES: hypothetical protein [unclassified Mesorhizobium]BCH23247.1 hypothetical protein MesoLjLb_30320 [Mesorhizobium sp. L-8-3]BCH31033.1 hypothetical protein MesoLjLc_29630 [Mesorhizobium sp. L-8-10]
MRAAERRAVLRVPACLLAVLCLGAPAHGQADSQASPSPEERCRAALNGQNPEADVNRGAGKQSLSEFLDHCRGVLKPPRTGDSEIAKPPPDLGETPVIRPDELPKQQQPE